MDQQTCYDYFSQKRFDRYLEATEGNADIAYKLYCLNENLSGLLHVLLLRFEVILRNRINDYMVSNYDKDWLVKLSQPGSIMDEKNTTHTYFFLRQARKELEKYGKLTNDDMVALSYLSFWTGLYQSKQHRKLNGLPIKVFQQGDFGAKSVEDIRIRLDKIRRLRNEVAHGEAIIFQKNSSTLDFYRITKTIENITMLNIMMNVRSDAIENIVIDLCQGQREIEMLM